MNIFDIYSRLAVTDHLVPYMQGAASGLLLALGTLTLCFAFFRAAMLGGGKDPLAWALRFVLVLGCLAAYPQIVDGLITGSKELTGAFIDKAGYNEYWKHVSEQFQPMFDDPAVDRVNAAGEGSSRPTEPSTLDRVMGLLRGTSLTVCVSLAYGVQFWAFETTTNLAILFVSILRLLGPFMIVAGIIGDGKTMKQWFSSMVQVLLWPVVPPMFMMITVGAGGHAAQTDNVVLAICQSLMLALFSLATPFVVAFIMGRGGIAAAAAAVTGLVSAGALSGLRAGVPALGKFLGGAGAAAGNAASSAAEGVAARAVADRAGFQRPADAARAALIDGDPTAPLGSGEDAGASAQAGARARSRGGARQGAGHRSPDGTLSVATADLPGDARPWRGAQARFGRPHDVTAPPAEAAEAAVPQRPAGHGLEAKALNARAQAILAQGSSTGGNAQPSAPGRSPPAPPRAGIGPRNTPSQPARPMLNRPGVHNSGLSATGTDPGHQRRG